MLIPEMSISSMGCQELYWFLDYRIDVKNSSLNTFTAIHYSKLWYRKTLRAEKEGTTEVIVTMLCLRYRHKERSRLSERRDYDFMCTCYVLSHSA